MPGALHLASRWVTGITVEPCCKLKWCFSGPGVYCLRKCRRQKQRRDSIISWRPNWLCCAALLKRYSSGSTGEDSDEAPLLMVGLTTSSTIKPHAKTTEEVSSDHGTVHGEAISVFFSSRTSLNTFRRMGSYRQGAADRTSRASRHMKGNHSYHAAKCIRSTNLICHIS
ncbi:hypothetical protein F4780DRAFT_732551 [Xylariomycetidae sp. FL0641]|nr:hypothetical protein F4780DRAFT_732551 [Xylariomycetidae sp. FL0641]